MCIDDPLVVLDACVTSDEMYNYGFDNFAGFPNNRDVGIVILDTPVILPEYGTITDAGAITATSASTSGVGLRHHRWPCVQRPDAVVPRAAHGEDDADHDHRKWTDGYNLKTQPNGGRRGGTCSGDSGGPVFYPAIRTSSSP